MIRHMSLTGGSHPLIQLGTSGGLKTSGYNSKAAGNAQTTGFIVANSGGSTDVMSVNLRLDRLTGNVWVASGDALTNSSSQSLSGEVDLGGELTQLALMNGTFDATGTTPEFNIKYLVG
jgi:hypothetical protein